MTACTVSKQGAICSSNHAMQKLKAEFSFDAGSHCNGSNCTQKRPTVAVATGQLGQQGGIVIGVGWERWVAGGTALVNSTKQSDRQREVQKHITSSLGSIVTTVYKDAPPCWLLSSLCLPLLTLPDSLRRRTPPSASSTLHTTSSACAFKPGLHGNIWTSTGMCSHHLGLDVSIWLIDCELC